MPNARQTYFSVDESQNSNLVKNDRQSGRFGKKLVLMVTFRDETSKTKCLSGLCDLYHRHYKFNNQHSQRCYFGSDHRKDFQRCWLVLLIDPLILFEFGAFSLLARAQLLEALAEIPDPLWGSPNSIRGSPKPFRGSPNSTGIFTER